MASTWTFKRAKRKLEEIFLAGEPYQFSANGDGEFREFLENSKNRLELIDAGYTYQFSSRGLVVARSNDDGNFESNIKPREEKTDVLTGHSYTLPSFHHKVKDALEHKSAPIMILTGPTGSGKTHYTRILAEELGMVHYGVTCRRDMDSSDLYGDKTVEVDEKSGQNYIKFLEGPVVKAMQHGLDAAGKEVGPPALLVVDEFPAIPAWVAIGLNNLMDNFLGNRTMTLMGDSGRIVQAHSGFRIMLLGNTLGRGQTGMGNNLYAAQDEALDISTLDRVSAVFRFGYNKKGEETILNEAIADLPTVERLIRFRDSIRETRARDPYALPTPFSTRTLVNIAQMYHVWGNIDDAIWYGVISRLPGGEEGQSQGEFATYCESYRTIWGTDLRDKYKEDKEFDF